MWHDLQIDPDLLILAIGAAGVVATQNISSLWFWRFFQSMSGSSGAQCGAIRDIFKVEKRVIQSYISPRSAFNHVKIVHHIVQSRY
jgi:hypothetical protein